MKRKLNDKVPITIRVNEDFHAKIKCLCEIEFRSLNNQIEFILQKYIKEYESKNGEIEIKKE